jgi:DNA-binding NarL/FixJ family response regulator
MDNIVSVAIIDDHDIFRLGLTVILNNIPYIKVIGDASGSAQLFNIIKQHEPDIIFMDIDLGDENGIEITKKVLAKYPKINIIAITSSDEIRYFKEMIDAGAVGFLLKNIKEHELKNAIEEILHGNMYFSKEFLMVARQLNPAKLKKSTIQISDREKEILRLICQGFSNQEIADELYLSFHTVDAHRRNLLSKINARNTAEMIMISFREGLINYE